MPVIVNVALPPGLRLLFDTVQSPPVVVHDVEPLAWPLQTPDTIAPSIVRLVVMTTVTVQRPLSPGPELPLRPLMEIVSVDDVPPETVTAVEWLSVALSSSVTVRVTVYVPLLA